MNKHLIDEELKITAEALNYKDGDKLNVQISLFNNDHKCLALYTSEIEVTNEVANYGLTLRSFLGTDIDKISYFKSCIYDGEVDCDAEIISKVIKNVDVIILV